MIIARVTISDKGNSIATNDEFSHGPIDLSTLSPIQELKLATLAQIKASEDLLKSQLEDREVIFLATNVLEKNLPSFKKDPGDSSSVKLRNMSQVVDSHFLSLEKAVDIKKIEQI